MSSMARAQLHQIQMEVPRGGGGELGHEGPAGLLEGKADGEKAGGEVREGEEEVELKPEHLEGLPVFLAQEDNVEFGTGILFLMRPDQAAKVLAGMPDARRKELVLQVSQTVQMDPEKLAQAREKLRYFVESYVAGQRRLLETLASVPEDLQEKILSELKRAQPKLAKDLRDSLARFEDLAGLDAEPLGLVLTQVSVEQLALALRGVDDGVKTALVAALPERMGAAVQKYLDLTAPQPLSKVREARRLVVEAWKKLAADGRVALAKKAEEPLV
jgi:flagellar motor switch protein FliG